MIKIVYYRSYHRVTAEGHACSAEDGRDLVCAAVSALIYTLANNVERLSNSGSVRCEALKTEPGDAEISCTPRHNMRHVSTLIFDTVCTGLACLAAQYPQYVSYEVRGM